MNIPESHQAVMPYLILKGAQKFIDFTTKVFDARVTARHTPAEDESIIMHAEINIDGSIIMFAESNEQWADQNAGLFIYVDDADDTFAKAKAEGAVVLLEPNDQDYGRTCGIKDPTGNVWWITSVQSK